MIEQLIVHGIVFVVMLFLYITSFSFPVLNIGGKLGSAWWPQFILGFGMILTIASAFLSIKKIRATDGKAKVRINKKEITSLVFSSAILVITLLLVNVIGFLGSIPLLVLGFMFQLGCKKPLRLVLVPVISTLVFTFLFGRIMAVSLPRGLGIMRAISFYIY